MATEIKKIISRRDTSAKWESNNPILAQGEIGVDTTNKVMKIGDGVMPWKSLKGVVESHVVNDLTTGGAEKALSAEMGKELREKTIALDSEIGNDSPIVLTASELIPMVWDGTKMVSSTAYKCWVIPLSEGREYSCASDAFIQSRRTCSVYPVIGEDITMTNAKSTFIASASTKYLVVTVTTSEYTGENYNIDKSADGLTAKINSQQEDIIEIKKDISAIGVNESSTDYTPEDFCGLLWGGNGVVNSNSTYNSILVEVEPNRPTKITIPSGLLSMWLFKEKPYVGIAETPTRYYDADTIITTNLSYLLIGVHVANFSSLSVYKGPIGIFKELNDIKNSLPPSLVGKTIVCFGDSLTEFNGDDGKGYGDFLAELTNATVVRGGIGGTQLATRATPVLNPTEYKQAYGAVDISNLAKAWANKDWAIVDNAITWLTTNRNDNNKEVVDRLKACPIENTDIVIVFGGTNDLNNGTYGKPTDTDAVGSVCGGINQIISSILSVKPTMTIYFFTPIPRMVDSETFSDDYRVGQTESDGSDLSFKGLVKRIKECVEYNHIPCCDMYYGSGITRYNIRVYADDGVHPNHGYSLIANRMFGYILSNRNWAM